VYLVAQGNMAMYATFLGMAEVPTAMALLHLDEFEHL
jgi:hypothetical protein